MQSGHRTSLSGKWVLFLLGMGAVALLILGRSSSGSGGAGAQTNQTVGVGQTLSTPDWAVQVTSVAEVPSLPEGNRSMTPQGKYVLAYLTVTNLQRRQSALGYRSFTLYDSAGREYSVAQAVPERSGNPTLRAAENANLKRFTTDLLPSLSLDTVLAFDVVPDARGFQLGVEGASARIALGR